MTLNRETKARVALLVWHFWPATVAIAFPSFGAIVAIPTLLAIWIALLPGTKHRASLRDMALLGICWIPHALAFGTVLTAAVSQQSLAKSPWTEFVLASSYGVIPIAFVLPFFLGRGWWRGILIGLAQIGFGVITLFYFACASGFGCL